MQYASLLSWLSGIDLYAQNRISNLLLLRWRELGHLYGRRSAALAQQ
jgi:hypothetical protein